MWLWCGDSATTNAPKRRKEHTVNARELVSLKALELANALKAANLTGPRAQELVALCLSASKMGKPQPETQPEKPKPKRTRPSRPVPAGTWNPNRARVVLLDGQEIPAPTIAKAITYIFDAQLFDPCTDERAATIAAAIQAAFPENNYKPYRVWADQKKFNLGTLPGQQATQAAV